MSVNTTNSSVLDNQDKPSDERKNEEIMAASLIIVIIAIVSIAGNGLVLMSYMVCSEIRKVPGNWLIFNLALSDVMNTVYIQIPSIVSLASPKFRLTTSMCTTHAFFAWFTMTASNWILAAISLDRAVAVNMPFQYRNLVTTVRVRVAMVFTWIFSLILTASLVRDEFVSFNNWELMCTPIWTTKNLTSAYFAATLCFYVPASIILLANLSIIYAVCHLRSVVVRSVPTVTGQEFSVQDHKKTLRGLYMLVVFYFFFSAPFFWAKFSYIKYKNGILPPSMFVLTIILMFLASAINPFIYAIFRKDLREAYCKCLKFLKNKGGDLSKRLRTVTNRVHVTQET